jgi:hypothetical protein
MLTNASPALSRKIFLFAKQVPLLVKPAVIPQFYTGINTVVLTVFLPVKTRYFNPFLYGTG